MTNYIDGYFFPLSINHLKEYKLIAEKVAIIWKEHGAISYREFISEDNYVEGTLPFSAAIELNENEVVIFGWIEFKSKQERDLAHERVASDPRMNDLVAPLMKPSNVIFDATRMVYGGFKTLVQ